MELKCVNQTNKQISQNNYFIAKMNSVAYKLSIVLIAELDNNW